MLKLDYIEIANALEGKKIPDIPSEEQVVFQQIWDTASKYESTFDAPSAFSKISAIIDDKPEVNKKTNYIWYAAASILVVASIFVFNLLQDKTISYVTNQGEVKELVLPDNSSVVLQGGSQLLLDKAFNKTNRDLKLEGVAFFEVTQNNNKPFIIETNKGKITVVGTAFSVHADDATNRFSVDVFEGIVNVKSNQEEKTLTLGMHLELNSKGTFIVSQNSNSTTYSPSTFNFVNTQIEDIIKEVENQFGISVTYDKSVAKERITLKTNAESADKLLSIISETMGSNFSVKK
jgi:transmembrane sensor